MSDIDKGKIEKYLRSKFRQKLKPEVLEAQIDGLVEDYIQRHDIIKRSTLSSLPTKTDIKWWFQDKPTAQRIKNSDGAYEDVLEVDVNKICLGDPTANKIFTTLYSWKWVQGCEIPEDIKKLVDIYIVSVRSTNRKEKEEAKVLVANYGLLGCIRFYHMERKPYLTGSQASNAIAYYKSAMGFIYNILSGTHKDKIVEGELYIFASLEPKDTHNAS